MRRHSIHITLILILMLINLTCSFAQQDSELRKVSIISPDSVIKTSINEKAFKGKVDDSRTYYWYYAGKIYHNQGGFSGKLLHGKYEVFDSQHRLFTVGGFLNGLKDGTWIRWNGYGKMRESCSFRKGKRNGALKTFTVSGNLLMELNYENDLLEGKSKYYLKDTVIVKRYKSGKEVPLKHRKLFSKKRNASPVADPKLKKNKEVKKTQANSREPEIIKSENQPETSKKQK